MLFEQLAQGGTAVGTGLNTKKGYVKHHGWKFYFLGVLFLKTKIASFSLFYLWFLSPHKAGIQFDSFLPALFFFDGLKVSFPF